MLDTMKLHLRLGPGFVLGVVNLRESDGRILREKMYLVIRKTVGPYRVIPNEEQMAEALQKSMLPDGPDCGLCRRAGVDSPIEKPKRLSNAKLDRKIAELQAYDFFEKTHLLKLRGEERRDIVQIMLYRGNGNFLDMAIIVDPFAHDPAFRCL